MKITIIGTAYPFKGGLASFNERMAQGLIDLGHNVHIESFTLQYPGFLFPGKTQMSSDATPQGLSIHRSINSVNPLSWWRTGHKIKRDRPDLVIIKYWLPFMGPAFGTILRLIKQNKLTKVICILDNVIPHEKRIGDVIFTKYFLKPIDAFVAMSREVLQDLRKFVTKPPAAFLPHPVYDNYGAPVSRDIACQHLGLDTAYTYLLFFGFIRKYKGLDLLLQAMADQRIRDSKIKLIVAGEYYGDAAYYTDMIASLGIPDQLALYTDFIPNDDVKYYFSASSVVVQPYKTATQSGISQIAYHFEKPMIVTNVGGLPEIVPHGKVGLVVAPEPEEIADAIISFFQQDGAATYTEQIKAEKQKYTWNHFLSQLLALAE